MSQPELLGRVVAVLDANQIEYMVTGSIASSLHGEPRASHDIDLVVALPAQAVDILFQAFPPPSYYLSRESMMDAVQRRSMFNLLWVDEGDKVDFWLLTDEPFDRSRFSRRYPDDVLGMRLQVPTPEDTILAKLRWDFLCGGSNKQFTDALRIYEIHRDHLDRAYLDEWVKQLGVTARWNELMASAAPS